MKSLIFSFCFSLLLTSVYAAEPPNISLVKQEIRDYVASGTYEKELAATIDRAKHYIGHQAALNQHKQKLAIILDIDETSLSNYRDITAVDFTANRQLIHKHILRAQAPAIKPMLQLYNEAIKQGVSVFFITGRNQSELQATTTNLLRAGYKNWTGLYVRPLQDKHHSVAYFKTETRLAISKQGYTIIASIGDQYSDLIGGYAKRTFKLPNPFYFLP